MQNSCICSMAGTNYALMTRLALALIFTALPWIVTPAAAQERPVIVTSFTVIEDWVQVIGDKRFKVINIIPARSEAHGFQLGPRHAKALSQAALIVGISPEFEPWLESWANANHKAETLLWLDPKDAAKDGASHPATSHPWTDPSEVRKMVQRLSGRLALLSGDDHPQAAFNKYLEEINQVDDLLGGLFRGISPDRRAFVSHHANLDQFAHHYGLSVAGTILEHGSAESADPSARHFSELLSLIRKQKIRVVVTDAGQNNAFARRLTEDSGIPDPLSLSFESLEPHGQPGDTWASMMLTNGRRLHKALLEQ